MFNSPYPNAFTDPKGTINLCARVLINDQCVETHILNTDATTQTAEVRIPGRYNLIVNFKQIVNVALKYADGTVIENFGAPRIHKPESIAYIQHAEL
jgi:hypothetical protein